MKPTKQTEELLKELEEFKGRIFEDFPQHKQRKYIKLKAIKETTLQLKKEHLKDIEEDLNVLENTYEQIGGFFIKETVDRLEQLNQKAEQLKADIKELEDAQ